MAKFLIYFCVDQLLSGAIEVEAESREAASAAFYSGDYDEARIAAKLDLEDSEDEIVEICDTYIEGGSFWVERSRRSRRTPSFTTGI